MARTARLLNASPDPVFRSKGHLDPATKPTRQFFILSLYYFVKEYLAASAHYIAKKKSNYQANFSLSPIHINDVKSSTNKADDRLIFWLKDSCSLHGSVASS